MTDYKALAAAIEAQSKKTKRQIIADVDLLECIPTGIPQLEKILETPGIVRRKILEIYGRESTGKSLLAATIARTVQQNELVCVYADWENSLNGPFLRSQGLNTRSGNFIPLQPITMEDGFADVFGITASGEVDVVILDSAGAMMPKAYNDKEAGYTRPGGFSLPLSICLQQLKADQSQHNYAVVIINQVRNTGFGTRRPGETTPGGNVLKFFDHQKVRLIRQEILRNKDGQPLGQVVKMRCEKNKVGSPQLEATIRMLYKGGVDEAGSLFDSLVEYGIITVGRTGHIDTLTLPIEGIRGRDNMIAALRGDMQLTTVALEQIAAATPRSFVDRTELDEEDDE